VLVVLLTSQERSQSSASSDTQEMLRRRLAVAQANLEQSRHLAQSLQAKAGEERWKEQVALLSTRKELQEALQETRDSITRTSQELDGAGATDPSQRLKALNAQLRAAQLSKAQAQNSVEATEQNIKRLKGRLAAMEGQLQEKLNELERPMRLPREHETAKRVLYVIARYGRIYPCRNADQSRNETDINWSSRLEGEIAEPIPDKGSDPIANPRVFETYLREQARESVYAAFCVFEDSFPAFIRAKELAFSAGIAWGWEPFRLSDGPVAFAESGHRPKPQ
jgi:hypothetical protein